MALLFVDSFDSAQDANAALRWDATYGSPETRAVRTDEGLALRQLNWIRKDVGDRTTLILGLACKSSPGFAAATIIEFLDDLTKQLYVRMNTDRTLTILFGDGTELGTSSSEQIIPASPDYAYLEFKARFHATLGSYELRVNGVPWFSATEVNTAYSGNNKANQVRLGWATGTGGEFPIDDLYICDDLGGVNDDFLGPVVVKIAAPDSVGDSTGFTPVGAAANWDCVNDLGVGAPDEASTYVKSSTVGQKDLYGVEEPGGAGDILGVQLSMRASRSMLTPRELTPMFRMQSTDSDLTSVSLDMTWATTAEVFDRNPISGLAWTDVDITGLQIGVRTTS